MGTQGTSGLLLCVLERPLPSVNPAVCYFLSRKVEHNLNGFICETCLVQGSFGRFLSHQTSPPLKQRTTLSRRQENLNSYQEKWARFSTASEIVKSQSLGNAMTIPFKHRRVLGYLDLLPLPKFLLEPLCGTEPKYSGVTKGGMWHAGTCEGGL